MALVKFGNGVSAISGKIEGNVYARNKAGAYIRNWAKPTNPQTPEQSLVRANFQQNNADFRALTQAQKDAWNSLADSNSFKNRLGEDMLISGIALFMKANQAIKTSNRETVDPIALLTDAPADVLAPGSPEEASFTAVVTAGVLAIDITSPDGANVPTGEAYVVEASPGLPSSKNNANNQFRYIATIAQDEDWSGAEIGAQYTAVFGVPSDGQQIQIRVRTIKASNGMTSSNLLLKPEFVTIAP